MVSAYAYSFLITAFCASQYTVNVFPCQQIYTHVSTLPGHVVFHRVPSHAVCISRPDAGCSGLRVQGLSLTT